MALVILGAGSWGTALAMHATRIVRPHEVVRLWSHRPEHCQQMQQERSNTAFLSPSAFPPTLQIESDFDAALIGADLVLIATPMAGLRSTLARIAASPCRTAHIQVAWLCKGFEKGSGLLGHEIQTEVAPHIVAGVFSGPSFAQEVAHAKPTAMLIASVHQSVRETTAHYFHSPSLRVYQGQDLIGVEVGGAVKNVLAIATGLCDGLQLGMNARAALITRGLAEMTRLGLALGAKMETFMGLTGLGDLVLTATGDLSRNRKVGLLLAQGLSLRDATASLGHVAEGVYSARTVVQRAQNLNIEMPISEAVVELLDGKLTPALAVRRLMERQTGAESS